MFLCVFHISPHRTENTEANLPESQEFLSGIDDKKTTRFTDVSLHKINKLVPPSSYRYKICLFICCLLPFVGF